MPQPRQPTPTGGAATAGAAAATATVGGVAASGPLAAGLAGEALTTAALAEAAKQVATALLAAATTRHAQTILFLQEEVQRAVHHPDAETLRRTLDQEETFEAEYRAKMRARVLRDVPKALQEASPEGRREALRKILEREKRIALAREEAIATRAIARQEQRLLEALSPEGGYWLLSPYVKEHTLDCLVLANKFWPWEFLREQGPPRHHGCPCRVLGLDEAVKLGLMTPGQVPDPEEAYARGKKLLRDAGIALDEGVTEEYVVAYLEELDLGESLVERGGARAKELLRWGGGTEKGGEFRPKRGGDAGRRVAALVGDLRHPAQNDRHRWTWIAGLRTRIPEAHRWERTLGGHVYSSPPGTTRVRRDGAWLDHEGEAAQRGVKFSPAVRTQGDVGARLRALADDRRARYGQQAEQAVRLLRRERPPISRGAQPSALVALEQAGFRLDAADPSPNGAVLRYHHRGTDARLSVALRRDGSAGTVEWNPTPAATAARTAAQGAPADFEAFRGDTLAWTDQLGWRFGAEVQAPDVTMDPSLGDHAGTHRWSGEIALGRDVPSDVDRAGRARAAGRALTDGEKEGVWAAQRAAAHEAAHAVNPIDPMDYHGAGMNLEEALAEDAAHQLAVERLREQGQNDVVAWRDRHPGAGSVIGVRVQERSALDSLLAEAGLTGADAQAEKLRLKFQVAPGQRMGVLADMVLKAHPDRDLSTAQEHVEATMAGPIHTDAPLPEAAAKASPPTSDKKRVGDLGGEALHVGDVAHLSGKPVTVLGGGDGQVEIRTHKGQEVEVSIASLAPAPAPASPPTGFLGKWQGKLFGAPKQAQKAKAPAPEPKPTGPPVKPNLAGPLPNWDHATLDLGKGAGGSTGARFARDPNRNRWLVKTYRGNEDRVATELVSNAIYRDMGARVPLAGVQHRPVGDPDFSTVPDRPIPEPPMPDVPAGKKVSTGVVIREPDGQVWIYEPKNHYGGYEHSFPKGRLEPDLTPQQNALKELWEETGLHGQITGHLGDYEGDTTVTRLYMGIRTGGKPQKGPETEAVKLVAPEDAAQMLNKERDKRILADALGHEPPTEERVAAAEDNFPKAPVRATLVYPTLEGKTKRIDKPSAELGAHYMTDALVGNWDFVGLTDDNVLWDPEGKPFRVDQGGTLTFRAQGKAKPFGPVPTEVWTLLGPKGQGFGKVSISEKAMHDQAREIAKKLTPERIGELVDAAPWRTPELRDDVKDMLKARVGWMRDFAAGKVDLPKPAVGAEARDVLRAGQAGVRLFPEQEQAVYDFADHEGAVQDSLRQGVPKDKASPVVRETIKELDSLLRHVETDEDLVGFVGINLDPAKAASEDLGGLVGKTMQERAYLTATTDEARATGTAVLRIHFPAGSHLLHLPSAVDHEELPTGAPEMVARRGQRFRVLRRAVEDGRTYVDAVALT